MQIAARIEGVKLPHDLFAFRGKSDRFVTQLKQEKGEIVRIRSPFSSGRGRETVLFSGAGPIESVLKRPDDFRTSGIAISGPARFRRKNGFATALCARMAKSIRSFEKPSPSISRNSLEDLPSRIVPLIDAELKTWPRKTLHGLAAAFKPPRKTHGHSIAVS